MLKPSKLSDHIFKKGKFVTPMHSVPFMKEMPDNETWAYGRMPEYLWIGLILKKYGRTIGLQKLYVIITKLNEVAPTLHVASMSQILALDDNTQAAFYEYLLENVEKEVLTPLTVFLTTNYAPVFSKYFFAKKLTIEDRLQILTQTMDDIMGHQTHEATDIRFVAVYFTLLSGRLHIMQEQAELLSQYPRISHDSEMMHIIRPTVRSMEMALVHMETPNTNYLKIFWECMSKMTDCELYSFPFAEEKQDISNYHQALHALLDYLIELFKNAMPLDDKMAVVLGLVTYSYKQFDEAYSHNLFNTIAGRYCVRSLIENYITLKYLIKNENDHTNIWKDFQLHGLGHYKLILSKHREHPEITTNCHFDQALINAFVNEFTMEEFIDMDTRYFDAQNTRLKAAAVDEKDLYGLYYDYDSAFIHGLWGAIRESTLLKCSNPAHQYHCVPDIDHNIKLKSVLHDCVLVMNKTISFLDTIYSIPNELLKGVVDYEIQLPEKQN